MALQKNDFSDSTLLDFQDRVDKSWIKTELYKVRNFHQAFDYGLLPALVNTGLGLIPDIFFSDSSSFIIKALASSLNFLTLSSFASWLYWTWCTPCANSWGHHSIAVRSRSVASGKKARVGVQVFGVAHGRHTSIATSHGPQTVWSSRRLWRLSFYYHLA